MFNTLIINFILLLLLTGCGGSGGVTKDFFYGTVTPVISKANYSGNSELNSGIDGSLESSLELIVTNTSKSSPYTLNNVSLKFCSTANINKCVTVNQLNATTLIYPIKLDTAYIKSEIFKFNPATPASYYVSIYFTVREELSGITEEFTNMQVATINFQ